MFDHVYSHCCLCNNHWQHRSKWMEDTVCFFNSFFLWLLTSSTTTSDLKLSKNTNYKLFHYVQTYFINKMVTASITMLCTLALTTNTICYIVYYHCYRISQISIREGTRNTEQKLGVSNWHSFVHTNKAFSCYSTLIMLEFKITQNH